MKYRKRYEEKVTQAAERNNGWRKLTRDEKIAELDRRLGKGIGARRQRARLTQ